MYRTSMLLISTLALAGCATPYQYVPAPGTPTATFHIGSKFVQRVKLGPSACSTGKINLDSPQVIPADERLYVESGVSVSTPVPNGVIFNNCDVKVSFVPKSNTDYFLLYGSGPGRCMVAIGSKDAAGKLQIEPIRQETFKNC